MYAAISANTDATDNSYADTDGYTDATAIGTDNSYADDAAGTDGYTDATAIGTDNSYADTDGYTDAAAIGADGYADTGTLSTMSHDPPAFYA